MHSGQGKYITTFPKLVFRTGVPYSAILHEYASSLLLPCPPLLTSNDCSTIQAALRNIGNNKLVACSLQGKTITSWQISYSKAAPKIPLVSGLVIAPSIMLLMLSAIIYIYFIARDIFSCI